MDNETKLGNGADKLVKQSIIPGDNESNELNATTEKPQEVDNGENEETKLMRQDIQKKLEIGSTRIWQDVQTKVGLLVVGSDVSELTIDQFLKLLDVIHR